MKENKFNDPHSKHYQDFPSISSNYFLCPVAPFFRHFSSFFRPSPFFQLILHFLLSPTLFSFTHLSYQFSSSSLLLSPTSLLFSTTSLFLSPTLFSFLPPLFFFLQYLFCFLLLPVSSFFFTQ